MGYRWLGVGWLALVAGCSSDDPQEPERVESPLCEAFVERRSCVPAGFAGCEDAEPDRTIVLSDKHSFEVEPPYDNGACSGRYLFEVVTDSYVPDETSDPMWLRTLWNIADIDTPEECADVALEVAVQRELVSGTWEHWDAFTVVGSWTEANGACETVFCGGGKLPDGEYNDIVGGPFVWVDIEGVRRVRVVASAYDSSCTAHELMLGAVDDWD